MSNVNTDIFSNRLEEMLPIIQQINEQFKDPVIIFSCNLYKTFNQNFFLESNYLRLRLHRRVFVTVRNRTTGSRAFEVKY